MGLPRTPDRLATLVIALWATGLMAGCTSPAVEEKDTGAAYRLRPSPVADLDASRGQTVYVPVYSHIEMQVGGKPYGLAANVSVRNTDLDAALTLVSVRYYDNDGKLLGEYLEQTETIPALGSRHYVVALRDTKGGLGANFIVEWRAEQEINEPIIEAVMIGTAGTQGFAFRSPGRVVEEHAAGEDGGG